MKNFTFTKLNPRFVSNFDIRQLLPGLFGQTLDMTGLSGLKLPTVTMNAVNIATDTTTGMQIATAATQKVGFFGATPVVQPASPAANTHTVAAGATTNVFTNTTFDGSIGTTAYTVGDIVVALKNLGLLAQ